MTPAETIRELSKTHGVYAIAKLLHEDAVNTSREYAEAGNDGAIVHSDAIVMGKAVAEMKRSLWLRAFD